MRLFTLTLLAGAALSLPAQSQTLERIRAKGEVTIGYRTDAAPLSYADADSQPAGYTVRLCQEIAKALPIPLEVEKIDIKYVAVDAINRFDKVQKGEIDFLCGAATETLRRRVLVDFSIPVFVDGTAVLLPQDASGNLGDLKGKKVGVRTGTTTEQALNNSFEKIGLEAEVIGYASHEEAMVAMEAGDISGYFADQSILYHLFSGSDFQEKFKISNEILTVEKQGIAMARGDADARLLVDSIISNLYNAGFMQELYTESLPNAQPGLAIRAMNLLAPTLP